MKLPKGSSQSDTCSTTSVSLRTVVLVPCNIGTDKEEMLLHRCQRRPSSEDALQEVCAMLRTRLPSSFPSSPHNGKSGLTPQQVIKAILAMQATRSNMKLWRDVGLLCVLEAKVDVEVCMICSLSDPAVMTCTNVG